VGDAVAEMLRPERFRGDFRRVFITGGNSRSFENGTHYVPQRLLIGDLDAAVDFGFLKAAKGLPHAAQVVQEMRTFKRAYTQKRGDVTYDTWRQSDHDDLIFAMALAFWGANMGPSYKYLVAGGPRML
jgi:hypothetical protein